MKHEHIIKRALTELHEPWMNDRDKEFFDAEFVRQFGAEFDAAIDTGVANGFTVEQQEGIVRAILRASRK